MGDGREDHDRLSDADEQGARADRGPPPVRRPLRPDRRGRPPAVDHPLADSVERRGCAGASRVPGHASADLVRPQLPRTRRRPGRAARPAEARPADLRGAGRGGISVPAPGAPGSGRGRDRAVRHERSQRGRRAGVPRRPALVHRDPGDDRAGARDRRAPAAHELRRSVPGRRSGASRRRRGGRVSWVVVVFGFCVLIVLHELGHFSVAKAVGMRVEKFSLFFPPTLWKTRRGETEYAIGAIPAGGYVRISGMNPSEDLPEEVRDRAYHAQPVWKRMAVIAAGPAVNFVLAFLLLFLFYAALGPRDLGVGPVQKGYPAYGKLKTGDKIVAVDGKKASPEHSPELIAAHKCAGKPVNGCKATTPAQITVLRNGKRITYTLLPRYDKKAGRTRVGFAYSDIGPRQNYGFGKSVDQSLDNLWFITRETVKLPGYIFNAQKRKQISGIVGVSDATHNAVRNDAGNAIFLFAVISLALAIINLFPFLPLDGGHIFWAFVEFVRRRPVPYAVMERAGVLGFMLVIGLFILGLTNDIDRLTSGTGVR